MNKLCFRWEDQEFDSVQEKINSCTAQQQTKLKSIAERKANQEENAIGAYYRELSISAAKESEEHMLRLKSLKFSKTSAPADTRQLYDDDQTKMRVSTWQC